MKFNTNQPFAHDDDRNDDDQIKRSKKKKETQRKNREKKKMKTTSNKTTLVFCVIENITRDGSAESGKEITKHTQKKKK